ncbi:MAG: FkbM family methyltransferase [Pseudomonadota bacterium]
MKFRKRITALILLNLSIVGERVVIADILPSTTSNTSINVDQNALEKNEIVQKILEDLVLKLKVYTVFDQSGPIQLVRHGRPGDGGYVVPRVAFEKADVLLGYGIADDISFEETFSTLYKKPSFGFDCGVESILINNKLCTFISECIANDSNVYVQQKSSGKFSTFPDQLKKFGIENKKIFIKMDIEGAEYAAFEGMQNYFANITGIVLEIHFVHDDQVALANKLLEKLLKYFYLVHLHANICTLNTFKTKYSNGEVSRVLELTFINKNLVTNAALSENQSYPLPIDMENCPTYPLSKFEILK